MVVEAPFGTWISPISAAAVAKGGIRLGDVKVDNGDIYWIERRPMEGGRNALVRRAANGLTTDLLPVPWSVRSMVHEYGGGSYAVEGATIVFVNGEDQQLYVLAPGLAPRALTGNPRRPARTRFADLCIAPDGGFVVAVRETHAGGRVTNDLVAVALQGRGAGRVQPLSATHDFVSSPRISPSGDRLAWLAWNHPLMPWDGTELWVADITAGRSDGAEITDARVVAGGPDESIVQPEWSADGRLHFVSDRSGWWHIHRLDGDVAVPLTSGAAEFAGPPWVFGLTWYGFLASGGLAAARTAGGTWSLGVVASDAENEAAGDVSVDGGTGRAAAGALLDTGCSDISYVATDGDTVVFVGGSPQQPQSVISIDTRTGSRRVLRSSAEPPDPAVVSVPQPVSFESSGDEVVHAFLYRPTNPDYYAPLDERPPLIVIGHGGPTSAARTTYDAEIQYWTSRGFAVADVNYRGSTGFGRRYRDALKGAWGVLDIDDCVAAARHLVEAGEADPARLVIRGGSAGGLTVLGALARADGTFAAGAARYPVADLEMLARDTHKFEARYLDSLVGPYPERRDVYVERSPIHRIDRMSVPLIVLQGLDDAVVPPAQSEAVVAALRRRRVPVTYLAFAGEAHGFRQAATVVAAAEAELAFFGRVLGFEPADPLPPLVIENLDA